MICHHSAYRDTRHQRSAGEIGLSSCARPERSRKILSVLSKHAARRTRTIPRAVLVALALLAWLAVGGFGGIAQGQLSQVQEDEQAAFLPGRAGCAQR